MIGSTHPNYNSHQQAKHTSFVLFREKRITEIAAKGNHNEQKQLLQACTGFCQDGDLSCT